MRLEDYQKKYEISLLHRLILLLFAPPSPSHRFLGASQKGILDYTYQNTFSATPA